MPPLILYGGILISIDLLIDLYDKLQISVTLLHSAFSISLLYEESVVLRVEFSLVECVS